MRNISLALRVTVDEYLRIKKRATKAHMSVTAFVVQVCLGKPEPSSEQILREFIYGRPRQRQLP